MAAPWHTPSTAASNSSSARQSSARQLQGYVPVDASLTLPAPCLVASDSALAECCAACARVPRIAFDTEFIRTDTFHPKLGLIQLCDGDTVWLVDPLAIGDFAPLRSEE